jgi:hypothetical protein
MIMLQLAHSMSFAVLKLICHETEETEVHSSIV